jgi:hypothetical protein
MGKDMKKDFTEEDIWMALLNIFRIGRIQIKTTMKYHYMPKIKKNGDNTKCLQGCGEIGSLIHCC